MLMDSVLGRPALFLCSLVVLSQIKPQECMIAPVSCPLECNCLEINCEQDELYNCDEESEGVLRAAKCSNFSSEILSSLPPRLNSLSILTPINSSQLALLFSEQFPHLQRLSVALLDNDLEDEFMSGVESLTHLNLNNGALGSFPNFVKSFVGLKRLNLSDNAIPGKVDLTLSFLHLEILDFSENEILEFSLKGDLGNLHTIILKNNQLRKLPQLEHLTGLRTLDLSHNSLILEGSNIEQDPASVAARSDNCKITLPRGIKSLFLRSNSLWKVPDKNCGPLADMQMLENLYLESNSILSLDDEEFSPHIYKSLVSLWLDDNKIHYISPSSMDNFIKLRFLSLSNNNLGRIPVRILKHIGKQLESIPTAPQTDLAVSIRADNNRFSCDCTQKEMLGFLNSTPSVLPKEDYICSYPHWLHGTRLSDLIEFDLQCFNVTLQQRPQNVSCHEFEDCQITCAFNGLPHPQTYWISPRGENITAHSIANDSSLRSSYSLTWDGQHLTILNLQYHETGIYRCISTNSQGSSNGVVQVGVILTPVGSIVAIIVSVVSFMVAIVLNSVNLCHYYCQHLSEKRAMREAEAMSCKMESPMKSKIIGLHESEASLNANKYYRKYDFTCQQVFLDTVIKGAHSVKRTLYDAKHSEFSNNVWEYASHLRDRLHIELPSSVQFPRVSMPSISMPTISMPNITMPSMPNFQSINTNIERLGTSVMHRSHNLATSVGSVFTLRWLRSGNSDNESDSDLEEAGFAEVEVHVHKGLDETSSYENSPEQTRKFSAMEGTRTLHVAGGMQKSENETITPRRTKSVRFSDGNRAAHNLRRSVSFTVLPQCYGDSTLIQGTSRDHQDELSHCVTVNVVSAGVPEICQYESTV